MILSSNTHLLFIEPTSKKMEPDCDDEITAYFEKKFAAIKARTDYTRGWHTCACGKAHSASHTFTISLSGTTYITNNLALHYIKNHRNEVPDSDLEKIRRGMDRDAKKEFSNGGTITKLEVNDSSSFGLN